MGILYYDISNTIKATVLLYYAETEGVNLLFAKIAKKELSICEIT